VGCLFTGFMITKDGPRVLEYNVRFGDPETQSVLPLLESDLADVLFAAADGKLEHVDLCTSSRSAATVILAAGGYPDAYKKGVEIKLSPPPAGEFTFSPMQRNS
jgi:phosphoribosylamine-glycine ligase